MAVAESALALTVSAKALFGLLEGHDYERYV